MKILLTGLKLEKSKDNENQYIKQLENKILELLYRPGGITKKQKDILQVIDISIIN